MKKISFLSGCIGCGFMAFAQFNDSVHHYINYASTGIINKTENSNSYVITNGLKFSINKKNIAFNSATSWIYGQQQHTLTNNDFSTSIDFDINKSLSHFYYWGLASYDKIYSLKINDRLQSGLGAAYKFIDRKNAAFNISDGLLYETSNLLLTDSTRDIYQTLRNSLRVRFRIAIKDNRVVLDGTNFLQNSLSNRHDYIIKSNTNLSVKLMKWLSFVSAVTYNKLSRSNRESLLITFGLTMERYF